jgi:kynurenine formamidase
MPVQPASPDPAEIPGYMTALSNWGRWGAEDELGTLNLITPSRVAAAAGLVTAGRPVSCAWPVDPAVPDVYGTPQRLMLLGGAGPPPAPPAPGAEHRPHRSAVEYIGLAFHGMTVTHLDAPAHVSWDGAIYNGRPAAAAVRFDTGATAGAVTAAARGITTRGVLLDVPALHGVPRLAPGHRVGLAELDACLGRQGVAIRPGDAVLLRTGGPGPARQPAGPGAAAPGAAESVATESGAADPVAEEGKPGWGFGCLPWLHGHDVALIGCDGINDAVPSGGGGHGFDLPVHLVGLVAMGLWLLDNCDFMELAATCAELGRWEFLFSVLPLRLRGGTGSPVNPVALF